MEISVLLENYCLEKIGVHKHFKEEWNAHLYMIDSKYFIMETKDKEGRDILTFKLNEFTNQRLQKEYPKLVVPGYYCNKKLWSSVYVDQHPTNELIRDLVDESYTALLSTFSKKRQEEISEGIL